jgi:hypothetical protein
LHSGLTIKVTGAGRPVDRLVSRHRRHQAIFDAPWSQYK